jgi:hypothetical protein
MSGRKHHEISTPLVRGRTRFESWRRSRAMGTRIPERLWTLAVKLTNAYGLNRTASDLRLDYYTLKRRVDSTNSSARSATPAFVELSPPVAAPRECVIEFEDHSGATMRVHLRGWRRPSTKLGTLSETATKHALFARSRCTRSPPSQGRSCG